jgi:anti-anti-sigma factor
MTDVVAVLTVKTARDGRICVLTLSGALDFTRVAGFLEHVARTVDDRTERFVLDLAGLAYLDCTGARALVLAAYAAPAGCPVIVRSISPPAAQLLELLNLDLEDFGAGQPAGPTVLSDR